MNFVLWSDLHLHHGDFSFVPKEDVIVIAGDTGEGTIAIKMLKNLCISHNKKVVYILGNHDVYSSHEFSGMNMNDIINYWKNAKQILGNNFFFLNNDSCSINGQRYLGTTLWSFIPPDVSVIVQNSIADFKYIRQNDKLINIFDYNDMHHKCIQFLKNNIHKNDIVILHHAPSNYGAAKRYKTSDISFCYYTEISNLLMDMNPQVVVYGHMHTSADYMMGDIRVVSNPRGYAALDNDSHNNIFNKNFIVETVLF